MKKKEMREKVYAKAERKKRRKGENALWQKLQNDILRCFFSRQEKYLHQRF